MQRIRTIHRKQPRGAVVLWLATLILGLMFTACGRTTAPSPSLPEEETMGFALTSPAFDHDERIPAKYTCDGEDISPPLAWHAPPEGTQSFALIVDDPDAPVGTWVHWVIYNIPADVRDLPERVPQEAKLPEAGLQGENGWSKVGYGGPCPPGGTHRYVFNLYALDTILDLEPGANKKQLLRTMEGHVLAETELIGQYSR